MLDETLKRSGQSDLTNWDDLQMNVFAVPQSGGGAPVARSVNRGDRGLARKINRVACCAPELLILTRMSVVTRLRGTLLQIDVRRSTGESPGAVSAVNRCQP